MTRGEPGRAMIAVSAAVTLLFFAAAPAAASPAADEYKLRFPNESSKERGDPALPSGSTESLPPAVARKLGTRPGGRALATLATAPELGAPTGAREDVDGSSSLLGALLRSLLDPLVLVVLVGLGAMFMLARRARRRADFPATSAGEGPA